MADETRAPLTFASLIAPLAVAEFFARFWQTNGTVISGRPDRFQSLFSWNAVNEMLNSGELVFPRLRMSKGGELPESEFTRPGRTGSARQLDPAKILNLCKDGATLIIDGLQTLNPAARQAVESIRADFGEHVNLSLYCSWPGGVPGFPLHFDAHEVFTLQVAGAKTWSVYAPTIPEPLHYQDPGAPPTDPYIQTVLRRGDVLYIPRGHWHAAVAEDEPSLHLTLSVTCRTGLTLLQWLADELRGDETWRRSLPLTVGAPPLLAAQRASWASSFPALRSSLARVLEDPDTERRFLKHLAAQNEPAMQFGLPFRVGGPALPRQQATCFYRPPFPPVQIGALPGEEGVSVGVGGRRLTVRGPVAALVRRLFSGAPVSGADLLACAPGLAWPDVVPLLEKLVREGIVFVVEEDTVQIGV